MRALCILGMQAYFASAEVLSSLLHLLREHPATASLHPLFGKLKFQKTIPLLGRLISQSVQRRLNGLR